MAELDLPKGEWKFEELCCDDSRGLGYVSVDGKDILHTGESSLWRYENLAIGHLSAAAPALYKALVGLNAELDAYWNEGPRRSEPHVREYYQQSITEWQQRSLTAITAARGEE